MPINEESSATKRYRAGDIDITESFPKNLYGMLKKTIPDEVYTPDQLGTYYYAFNTQKGPTADARVRRALSGASIVVLLQRRSWAPAKNRHGTLPLMSPLASARNRRFTTAQPGGAEFSGESAAGRRGLRADPTAAFDAAL